MSGAEADNYSPPERRPILKRYSSTTLSCSDVCVENFHQGASIKYVRRFSGFLDPLPRCLHFGLNRKSEFTQPPLLRTLLGPLPPSPSVRTYFMDAPLCPLSVERHPPAPLGSYPLQPSYVVEVVVVYRYEKQHSKRQGRENHRTFSALKWP